MITSTATILNTFDSQVPCLRLRQPVFKKQHGPDPLRVQPFIL